MDGPRIAGIDIDGVLADPSHRLHFLDHRPKDWRGFFAAADADPLLPMGADVVTGMAADGMTIVYVSGRPESLRNVTRDWLARHELPEGPMHLRRARDFRPAAQVKTQLYRRISQEFPIGIIVDDDVAVVAALKKAGFPVRHADWFQPPEPLGTAQESEGRT